MIQHLRSKREAQVRRAQILVMISAVTFIGILGFAGGWASSWLLTGVDLDTSVIEAPRGNDQLIEKERLEEANAKLTNRLAKMGEPGDRIPGVGHFPPEKLTKIASQHFETGAELGFEMARRGGSRDDLVAILFPSKRENNPALLKEWFETRLPVITLENLEPEKRIESVTLK